LKSRKNREADVRVIVMHKYPPFDRITAFCCRPSGCLSTASPGATH